MLEICELDGETVYINPDRIQWFRQVKPSRHKSRPERDYDGPVCQLFFSEREDDFKYVRGAAREIVEKFIVAKFGE